MTEGTSQDPDVLGQDTVTDTASGTGFTQHWPELIGMVLLTLSLTLIANWMLWHRSGGLGGTQYVTFDPVKYGNAQRAIASGLIGSANPAEQGDIAMMLTSVSKQTQAALKEVAGEGRVILVKQAVIEGSIPDITDDVLRKLGLPTDVPTVDPSRFMFEVAPTDLTFSLRGGLDPLATTRSKTQGKGNGELVP